MPINKSSVQPLGVLLLILLGLQAGHIGAQVRAMDSGQPEVRINEQFGSLDYRVPLPRLPSRAGVEPDLQLAYRHMPGDAGQGFGVAWSVHVPSITILNETHLRSHAFNDSIHDSFDSKFRLAWDGAPLSFVNFDRENALVEYSLEKSRERLRIYRHFYPFVVEYLAEDGRKMERTLNSGFEILYPDGRRQFYSGDLDVAEGREVDSSDPDIDPIVVKTFVSRWPLVLEVHPGGEAIHYSYIKDQGRSFLERVSFAGGHSFYQWSWILRRAGPESMAFGFPQQSRLLYTGMAACFQSKALHTWRFDYGGDLPQDRPAASCDQGPARSPFERPHAGLIKEVREGLRHVAGQFTAWANRARAAAVGEKTDPNPAVPRLVQLHRWGEKREPFLRFRYTARVEPAAPPVLVEASTLAGGMGFGPGGNSELIDVNRDGRLDLIKSDGHASRVWFNEGQGYDAQNFVRHKAFTINRISHGQNLAISPVLNEVAGPDLFIRGDVDGDGWMDLMEIKADGTPFAYLRSVDPQQTFTAAEHGIQEITDDGERALKLIPDQIKKGRGILIDVSGDGKDDLLSAQANTQGRLEWSVLINETPRSSTFLRFKKQTYALPFSSSDPAILEGAELRFVDMNRDGLIDLVRPTVLDGAYGLCVYDNLGRAGFPNSGDSPLFDGSPSTEGCRADQFRRLQNMEKPDRVRLMRMWVFDIDGDGAQDFAELRADGRTLDYWLAVDGQRSFQERRSLDLFSEANPTDRLSLDHQHKSNAIPLDLDQDGQDELLIYQPTDRQVKVLDFNRHAPPSGWLYAVESEDGALDQFIYTSHVQELRQERTAVSSIPSHQTLVKQWIHRSSQTFREGTDDRQIQTWHYAKAMWDGSMGRWLGYAKVTMEKTGAMLREQSRPAQRTVHDYSIRTDSHEAQRYLSDSLTSAAIYELPWSREQEKRYEQYLNGLDLEPSQELYRSELAPQFKGSARLLKAQTYHPRYQVFTSSAEGALTNFRSHALIGVEGFSLRTDPLN